MSYLFGENLNIRLLHEPVTMLNITEICEKYKIALCYLFGSQKEQGLTLLQREHVSLTNSESDIDFAVLFKEIPNNHLDAYARLSLDLQDLMSPFKADLFFCMKLITLFN